jgi:uncharacterized HhH-GPD family protein
MATWLAGQPDADALLDRNAFALLVGMVLDQQIPIEKAFTAPYLLMQRLDVADLDPATVAATDVERLVDVFTGPPALHRFPRAMAERVHRLARLLVDEYDGDAEALWRTATTGQRVVERLAVLPGFGPQKAKIFLALLGKQRGFRPRGWRQAAEPFAAENSFLSVADVVDAESLAKVRATKKEMKAGTKRLGSESALRRPRGRTR